MIEVKDLNKSFGKKRVLKNVNYIFKPGITGILGENGAGKSTLLNLLTTLIKPDSGDIAVDRESIFKNKVKWKERIGVVPEFPELFNNLTIDEHIRLNMEIYNTENRDVDSYLDFFDIRKYKNTICGTCSQGMKKKLSIILAIIHDPDVLIFDEPFNGLDIIAIRALRSILIESRNRGKVVIITTHLLDSVEKILDEVVLLKDGHITQERCDDILTKWQSLEDFFFEKNKKLITL